VNHAGQSGWVFENFLDCPGGRATASTEEPATGPEPQPERPFGPRPGRFRREMGGPG
jgi:hypothetical protein